MCGVATLLTSVINAVAQRDKDADHVVLVKCYILGLIAGLSPLSLRFVGLRGDLMISDVLANADW